jgi:hypothetical protein
VAIAGTERRSSRATLREAGKVADISAACYTNVRGGGAEEAEEAEEAEKRISRRGAEERRRAEIFDVIVCLRVSGFLCVA